MHPTLDDPFPAGDDVHVLPTYWPMPQGGVVPMNAFLLRAGDPVLVDTGVGVLREEFIDAFSSLIDPADLRWIFLTHEDRDHTGALDALLDLAPRVRIAATSETISRVSYAGPLPQDRVHVVNPGDVLDVGDRRLGVIRPPLFDSPGTVGFLDAHTGALFSSDCFGAALPTADQAAVSAVEELPPDTVAHGQLAWASADSAWVGLVEPAKLHRAVNQLRRLQPRRILSSHLPPIHSRVEAALDTIASVPDAGPAPPMTKAALQALLDALEPDG